MQIAFDNSYARMPDRLYSSVAPTKAPEPKLIRVNRKLADQLGFDLSGLDDDALAEMFSGNRLPDGAMPIAMAYSGHQFGHFNAQLGDGRAILMGEVIDRAGERRDIQLKGAGETPYSRNGDGRAALGPVLREYLVSEAMAALGVPTTRALAAVSTGEQVVRETLLPGAVFTRVAASHIRIGTFQYFAARGDAEALQALADHAIARHYPELAARDDRYLAFLTAVAGRQAELIAQWMSIGFIHGVMNTDNMTVSGETIDFGPCAFMDAYDPQKVFSSIDRRGRYAYAKQPAIGQWNLARLAEALLTLLDEDQDKAVEAANAVLVEYGRRFQAAWLQRFRAKLGLTGEAEEDLDLVTDLLALMHGGEADFTVTFRALSKLGGGAADQVFTQHFNAATDLGGWLSRWRDRLEDNPRTPAERQAAMEAVNPAVIPRNHRIEEAISAAIYGDFSFFDRLNEALEKPYEEIEDFADYRRPPRPEELVTRTFCGT